MTLAHAITISFFQRHNSNRARHFGKPVAAFYFFSKASTSVVDIDSFWTKLKPADDMLMHKNTTVKQAQQQF